MSTPAGFEGLLKDADYLRRLREAYPDLDLDRELKKMQAWLEANPRRRYRNYKRFIVNWLNREDRYGRGTKRQEIRRKYAGLAGRDLEGDP